MAFDPDSQRLQIPAEGVTADRASRPDHRGVLVLASLVTLALWYVPYSDYFLYPLRLLVTFVHEGGHALAAVLTGGSVESLTVYANGEGVTYTRTASWARGIVLSGGYLGTTLFGAALLQVGRLRGVRNPGRAALYALAAMLVAITILWAHNPLTNAFTYAAGFALATLLALSAVYLPPSAADFAASFLAVQVLLNALGDLRSLLRLTTDGQRHNDAGFMAEQYWLPATFWALAWAALAVVILIVALRSAWRRADTNTPGTRA